MSEEHLLYEKREDGVGLITLNRPERLNAMSRAMMSRWQEVLREATADAGVRCVAVTGAGRAFSAGGDVKEMAKDPKAVTLGGDTSDEAARLLAEAGWAVSGALATMPKPTVALVNGFAMGASLSIACACDIRLASSEAKFGTAFRNVGLSGDFGGSYFLPRLVGTARARELYFTGEIVDAERALGLGLANHVYPAPEFMSRGLVFCAQLASGPTLALGRMKTNLNRSELTPLWEQLRGEALHHRLSSLDADHRSAAAAFVEKRPPVFEGR